MSENKRHSVVQIEDGAICEELEQTVEHYGLNTTEKRESFAGGFQAGVTFACRSQVDLPCFCGFHVSQVDLLKR